jgi:hypothetical protein
MLKLVFRRNVRKLRQFMFRSIVLFAITVSAQAQVMIGDLGLPAPDENCPMNDIGLPIETGGLVSYQYDIRCAAAQAALKEEYQVAIKARFDAERCVSNATTYGIVPAMAIGVPMLTVIGNKWEAAWRVAANMSANKFLVIRTTMQGLTAGGSERTAIMQTLKSKFISRSFLGAGIVGTAAAVTVGVTAACMRTKDLANSPFFVGTQIQNAVKACLDGQKFRKECRYLVVEIKDVNATGLDRGFTMDIKGKSESGVNFNLFVPTTRFEVTPIDFGIVDNNISAQCGTLTSINILSYVPRADRIDTFWSKRGNQASYSSDLPSSKTNFNYMPPRTNGLDTIYIVGRDVDGDPFSLALDAVVTGSCPAIPQGQTSYFYNPPMSGSTDNSGFTSTTKRTKVTIWRGYWCESYLSLYQWAGGGNQPYFSCGAPLREYQIYPPQVVYYNGARSLKSGSATPAYSPGWCSDASTTPMNTAYGPSYRRFRQAVTQSAEDMDTSGKWTRDVFSCPAQGDQTYVGTEYVFREWVIEDK